jgi:hypothetical protein
MQIKTKDSIKAGIILFITVLMTGLCFSSVTADNSDSKTGKGTAITAYPIPLFENVGFGLGKGFIRDEKTRGGWKRGSVPLFKIPKQHTEVLKVVAPRNGIGSGQILLKSNKGTIQTKVTVTDLKTSSGKTITSDKIRIRYGQYATGNTKSKPLSVFEWKQSIAVNLEDTKEPPLPTPDPKGNTFWTIDPLLPEKSCKLHKDLPRTAWFTVQVAKKTAPGTYKGTIKVNGGPNVPLELLVVNATLPDLEQSPMG